MAEADLFNTLVVRVYDELRRLAHHIRAVPDRPGHRTTSLVHEAYLKLAQREIAYQDKQHFMRVAGNAMRRLLVDEQRRRRAAKRGGEARQIPVEDLEGTGKPEYEEDLIALDDALEELAEVDRRKCSVVELRFFAGCTLEEVAECLSISTTTAHREWSLAKTWLCDRMGAVE